VPAFVLSLQAWSELEGIAEAFHGSGLVSFGRQQCEQVPTHDGLPFSL
jgi:hypothetical protein